MVSQDAKNSFNSLLNLCLQEALRSEAVSAWNLRSISNDDEITGSEIYMLTISSYEFRIFLILHFDNDKMVRNYVANAIKVTPENMTEQRFYDYLGEVGNAFCGVFKRELGKYFPHLGMSTPNHLESISLKHLDTWSFDYDSHLKASAGDDLTFFGSVYVTAFGDIDFRVKNTKSVNDDVQTGALELF
jgi:hypothetical protein